MAAFSLTASSIKLSSGNTSSVTAKETVAAGQAVTSDGYVVDPTNSNKYQAVGVAIQNASSGGKIVYAINGATVSFTDTLTQGVPIFADASGQLQYTGDLTASDRVIQIGHTVTTTSMRVSVEDTGITKA